MVTRLFDASHADVYRGTGEFEDSHTVRVLQGKGRHAPVDDKAADCIRGQYILIATGSSPVCPGIFPFESKGVYDSDTILDLERLPRKMAIVGASTIGCEYACIFAALSAEVHVIDARCCALPFLDAEIAKAVTKAMQHNGIRFHWNEWVQACRMNGKEGIVLTVSSGAPITVDTALIAAGRKSNTERLNLDAAGIAVGDRGWIPVDKHFRTHVSHIYAAGDVIGPPALASTGMEEARRAVRHAFCGLPVSEFAPLLPTGVYTIPEAAMVGETEEALKQNGVSYIVGRAYYDRTPRGKIVGDSDGLLKLLVRREDLKLLGVHVMGEQATELIHVGLIAMLCNATARLFDEACFNLPTFGQLYKIAALDAIRQA
jgi:NAD(P) transhydrogenase